MVKNKLNRVEIIMFRRASVRFDRDNRGSRMYLPTGLSLRRLERHFEAAGADLEFLFFQDFVLITIFPCGSVQEEGVEMTMKELVRELISTAYDTGYYSGKKEDGEPHHVLAIANRNALRDELLRRVTEQMNIAQGI